jgi:hypothetical protein
MVLGSSIDATGKFSECARASASHAAYACASEPAATDDTPAIVSGHLGIWLFGHLRNRVATDNQ